jgi:hypothetical protein
MDDEAFAIFDSSTATPYMASAVTSVNAAVARMEALSAYIADHESRGALDGLACFNHLYTVITRRVRDGIADGFFEDIPFITQLDVEFANRYFDAIRAHEWLPGSAPRAWQVLFDRRSNKWIEPMQFAIAGVNAHVNLDLCVAVVNACAALRTHPTHGHQHTDYLRINDIFAEEMKGLRQHYESGFSRMVDNLATPVLDAVCNWSVVTYRNIAWHKALELWDIRRRGRDDLDFITTTDVAAARKAELILTPLF